MFRKTLTAAVAALTLTGATLTPMHAAQAGSIGKVVAAAVVGVAVGAIAAGKARSQEGYQERRYQERGDRSEYRPVRGYDRYEGGCGRNSPIFDEDGNRIGSRRVPAC